MIPTGKGRDPGEGLRELGKKEVIIRRGKGWGREKEVLCMVLGFLLARARWIEWVGVGVGYLGLGEWVGNLGVI
jgi:hypothetical protein